MGSAATFADLIASPSSEKVFLVEAQVSEQVQNWTKTGGYTYVYQKAYTDDAITLPDGTPETIRKTASGVRQNTIAYTAKTSIAEVEAAVSTYWHDTANGLLYIHTSDGTAPGGFTILVLFWLYFATKGIHLDGRYYEPYLAADSIPNITQELQAVKYGVVTVSSGRVVFVNQNGYFDQISKRYIWINHVARVLMGGDALPYGEYEALFRGKVTQPRFSHAAYELSIKSVAYDLLRSLPVNNFWTSAYSNLDPAAVGRAIPLYYGSYDAGQAPVVTCIDTAYGTNTYQFKICDTTYRAIKAINQVYVNYQDGAGWQTISHANTNLTNATFTIAAASFVVGTSLVKVAFDGYHDSGTLIEGAPEICEDLLTTWCGLSADDLDSTSFADSKTSSSCTLNVPVERETAALTIIERICASDLAYFFENEAGQLRYKTWALTPVAVIPELTAADIWDVEFEDDISNLYWRVRVGYAYQCAESKYLYAISTDAASRYKFNRDETLTLETYLRTATFAVDLADRMLMVTKSLQTVAEWSMSVGRIDSQLGDSLALTLKRSPSVSAGGQAAWPYEIISKDLSISPAVVRFRARDISQLGQNVGFWTADIMPAWIDATAAERAQCGYWTDGDGYADTTVPPDAESQNISLWW